MSENHDALAELIRKAKASRNSADRAFKLLKADVLSADHALMALRHDLNALATAVEAERAA